jgi:hypothetical protein
VVSSTTSGTFCVRVITSGASDEPPIPASTTRSTPSACSAVRRATSSGRSARDVSCNVVQERRMLASDSASGPHRVGSCAVSLLGTESATRSAAIVLTWSAFGDLTISTEVTS